MIPNDIFTLANIYKYASDDELRAIVSSICLRVSEETRHIFFLTDWELNEVAKGLRTPK